MAANPELSVLIAAYNKEAVLARTLRALARQSYRDFEVIVCDDGSAPELGKAVRKLAEEVPYPLLHTWHEDLGFRKCRILNRGLLLARSDYIVVLDPDCLPHRHFLRGHAEERRPDHFLAGRRLMIGPALSRAILEERLDWRRLESLPGLVWHWYRHGGGRHLEAGVHLPRALRTLLDNRSLPLKGCNMSFWKKDLERINGFEETFEVPCGGEDTDLERRLRLIGLQSRSVKHAAICYHLDHPLLPRDGKADRLCRDLAERNVVRALRGLADHPLADSVKPE